MTVEQELDKQLLNEMKTQADRFSDNWTDATGRGVSRQLYQLIEQGIRLSLQKNTLLGQCEAIRAQCEAVLAQQGAEPPEDGVRTLTLER